jgi:hypothetical protein
MLGLPCPRTVAGEGGDVTAESTLRWAQLFTRIVALTAALLIGADEADMRLADGLNFSAAGSGGYTFLVSASAAERVTKPAVAPAPPTHASTYQGGSLNDLFKRGGLLGGFAAGFLGAGVLGLLFGRGLIGGLDGAASYVGLVCQLVLLAMLARLIWIRWRGADAGLSPRQLADPYLRSRSDLHAGLDRSANARQSGGRGGEPASTPAPAHPHEVTDTDRDLK